MLGTFFPSRVLDFHQAIFRYFAIQSPPLFCLDGNRLFNAKPAIRPNSVNNSGPLVNTVESSRALPVQRSEYLLEILCISYQAF